MNFTWDKVKSLKNEKKHRVTFHEAATVFDDPLALTFADPDHSEGEYRFLTFGHSRFQRLLAVAHTDSDDEVRIISSREMTRSEQKIYEQY